MPGLPDTSIMDEKPIKRRLGNLSCLVGLLKAANIEAALCGVGPVDGVEMAGLDLRRRSDAAPIVAAEANLGQPVRRHPHVVVFLNRRGKNLAEPLLAFLISGQAAVNGRGHRGEKRRLRACQKIGAVGVQDFSVAVDLIDEIIHHGLRQIDPTIFEQAQRDEVAVPTVHLVETPPGNHEGQAHTLATDGPHQGEAQNSVLPVEAAHIIRGDLPRQLFHPKL